MEVESSICLSDLVPALRWSRPQQVAEVLGDPRLPAGWWSSLALSKALGTAGLDWICERLARLASSRWDHLPLTDLIPALTVHQVDPALPGWPEATRTAVAGLGGWQRLRRLSPSDLSTPSATPEVVIGSIFREILGRIPAQRQAAKPDHPEVTRPLQRGAAPAQEEARGAGPEPQTGSFAAQSGSPAERPEGSTQQPQTAGPFAAAQGNGMPQRQGGAFPGQPGSFPAAEGTPPRPAGQPSDGAPARQTGSFPVQQDSGPQRPTGSQDSGAQRETGSFPAQQDSGPQRQTGSFPGQPDSGPQPQAGSFPAQSGASPAQPQGGAPRQGFAGEGGLPQRPGQPERLPQRPGGPQPGRQDTGSLPRIPAPGASGPGGPSTGSFPAIPGGPSTGSFPAIPGGPSTGSFPAIPAGDAPKGAAPRTPAYPTPATGSPSPVPSDTDHAMVRVVDSLFRSLDKLELAVAVHRLFAEDPVSLRTLAHKMLVERDALSQAQRTAEERVLHWLRSSESAPVTGHMFRLTEWLGAAATEDQLIGADPAHPVMVPSLRTPLWRVLVTLMPDRRLQDGWLVVGDLHGLQARTRQLLASSPPDTDVVELMAELGIRAHSAQAWLDALPPESAPGQVSSSAPSPAQPLPRRTPGANGHHHRGGQPIPPATTASIDPSAALATLSALSGGRSGVLPVAGAPSTPPAPLPSPSSDPRRWQRIEVTPEHLRGGPVPVPEGYAAQLGMRPGTLLSVTGPGDNAIVLVWQGHQPVFDSLQPVLMRLNARPGDQVYVTVDGYRLEAQLTA
ncbi:hypothetical protein EDD27_5541 [Nonomuraea polychroma]|uniref:Uncharacterized protein n=1 Tax=Nonomuraea polychroma TaxID=46176 RepID=A0A438MAY8_9ACTN|nr:hypothetical protein [Nonomuraea polychroma]RVX42876.1 hypothetical protein EDD27_5541 [Nonomuraea polychroma]